MRTVYLDGAFVPEAEAKLSIYDLSVMQAAAAFEMTRSFGGVHFKLKEHIARLIQSCDLLSIPIPDGDWYPIIDELTERNAHGPGEEHRLLIVVSPGCAPIYSDMEGTIAHPFLYVADFPLRYTVQGFGKYFTEGVHAVTSTIRAVPSACLPAAAKHRSRLHFHLAQSQAPAGTWPILTDPYGYLREAPGANVVYVRQGQVWIVTEHVLQGISMQTVAELTHARPSGLLSDDFPDELWLTGTPFCMLPVVSLDGQPIGDGTIGPVFRETLAKWNHLVGLDIAQQILDWDEDPWVGKVWTPRQQRILEARAQRLGPT